MPFQLLKSARTTRESESIQHARKAISVTYSKEMHWNARTKKKKKSAVADQTDLGRSPEIELTQDVADAEALPLGPLGERLLGSVAGRRDRGRRPHHPVAGVALHGRRQRRRRRGGEEEGEGGSSEESDAWACCHGVPTAECSR